MRFLPCRLARWRQHRATLHPYIGKAEPVPGIGSTTAPYESEEYGKYTRCSCQAAGDAAAPPRASRDKCQEEAIDAHLTPHVPTVSVSRCLTSCFYSLFFCCAACARRRRRHSWLVLLHADCIVSVVSTSHSNLCDPTLPDTPITCIIRRATLYRGAVGVLFCVWEGQTRKSYYNLDRVRIAVAFQMYILNECRW